MSDAGTKVGQYDYDAAGLRVKRKAAAETVEYFLDDGHVLREADGGVPEHPGYRRYHYGYGPLSVTDTNGKRFIQTDALGSRALPVPGWGRGGAEQFEVLDPIPTSNFGRGEALP